MTGEVTARPRAAVGGVREGVGAARRHQPMICRERPQDLPQELKRRIRFIPVDHMNEVLEARQPRVALRRLAPPRPAATDGSVKP
jgi:ATP-dependent Lon protease